MVKKVCRTRHRDHAGLLFVIYCNIKEMHRGTPVPGYNGIRTNYFRNECYIQAVSFEGPVQFSGDIQCPIVPYNTIRPAVRRTADPPDVSRHDDSRLVWFTIANDRDKPHRSTPHRNR